MRQKQTWNNVQKSQLQGTESLYPQLSSRSCSSAQPCPALLSFSGLYIIFRSRLLSASVVFQGRFGGLEEKAAHCAPVLSSQETNAIFLGVFLCVFLFGNGIKWSHSHLDRKMVGREQQSVGSCFWYVSTFQLPDPLLSQNHLSGYQRYTSITSHPSSYGHGMFRSLTY